MSRRAAGALLALAVLVLAFAVWRLFAPGDGDDPPARVGPASGPATEPAATVRRSVTLWLPGRLGRIEPLRVEIDSGDSLGERLDALLGALVAARPAGDLAPLFPEPVTVAAAIVGPDRVLYVDLRGAEGGEPPGAGSTLEQQRVFAVVHTVLRNEPEIAAVVLLWNGVQRPSLSGHVDTTRPLGLRPQLELE
jgi:hypothetical protein